VFLSFKYNHNVVRHFVNVFSLRCVSFRCNDTWSISTCFGN